MDTRAATRGDESAINALLAAAALPSLDKDRFRPGDFVVAIEDDVATGAVGIERYGNDGLLRSLVVIPAARSRGLGTLLVEAVEKHARTAGLHSLVLLTTTADQFFGKLGYRAIARDDVPIDVRASSQFSGACPASAICMRKAFPGRGK